jgi:hypothetical protein
VAAGAVLTLGHYASANPDCTSRGKTVVRVETVPMHGSVHMVETTGFSHFTENYESCNSRRIAGVTVQYRPQRGYIGDDAVGLDVIYPNGFERRFSYTITVK